MISEGGARTAPGVIRTFLIADVRGYTVFTNEHGDEAAAELAARFAVLAEETVAARDGTVIELRGDEALAVFESARQAIRAAVDLQRRFVDETIANPSRPLAVGIGLDAGEAVPVGDGYRGGALNLAARLCSVAGPAEILASREVVHLARKVEGIAFVDRGAVRLKGLADPVDVIRVRAEAEDAADDLAFRRALGPAATRLTPAAPGTLVPNPYKGLRPFDEADAADFFGRETLVAELVERLGETRFLAVVGPSGSGKSSVVRAGLLPALRAGALEDSSRWRIAEMYPGAHPLEELEAALLKTAEEPPASLIETLERDELGMLRALKRIAPADGAEILLFVDQFEEVFTLVEDEERRALFLDSLRAAVTDARSRLRVVITLRADFYDRPLQYFGFGDLLRTRVEALIPLSPDELERAISGPAKRVDVRLEDGLVLEMLGDVADEPGALPLLQYALTQLFDRREGDVLTREAYRAVGRVAGALGRRAEELYVDLDTEGQTAARQLFLRLVALGEGTEDTRRPVPRSEIDSLELDPGSVAAVLDTYGAARLLSFDRDSRTGLPTVEVAHEALLSAWPRLRRWIDDAREDLRVERRLALATGEWLDADEDGSFLARGARLEQFEAWRAAGAISITPEERRFLDASTADRDRAIAEEETREARERELEKRSIRRLRTVVAVLAVAAVVAGAITAFAVAQRNRAEEEERDATARELSAAAVASLEQDPERSVLLALEAVELARQGDGLTLLEAESALHRAVTESRIVRSIRGLGGALDWSVTGLFVTEGPEQTGIVDIRDAEGNQALEPFRGHDIDVNSVVFSPDGSILVTSGDDDPRPPVPAEDEGGAVRAWDVATGEPLWEVHGSGPAWVGTFSEDGARVAAAWLGDGTIRVIDASSGAVIQTIDVDGFIPGLSPDGARVAIPSFDNPAVGIYDVASGERISELSGHVYPVNTVAWSPDGRWIATASFDSSVKIWDGDEGTLRYDLSGHTGGVLDVDWSADSHRLVSGSQDGTARLWEVSETGASEVLRIAAQETRSGTFARISPDGAQVMTSDTGVTVVKIWDVGMNGSAEIANVETDELAPVDVAFLPDGELVAPSGGRSVTVWSIDDRTATETVTAGPGLGEGPVHIIDVSDDGSRMLTVRLFSPKASVWDAAGEPVFEAGLGGEIAAAALSPDGTHVVIGGFEGGSFVFDATGTPVADLPEDGLFEVSSVRFSLDSGVVFVTSLHAFDGRGRLTIWNWADEAMIEQVEFEQFATGIDVAPDGTAIAFGTGDGRVEIRDATTGAEIRSFSAGSGPVDDVDYSPDGTTIVTAGEDGTVRLFETATGRETLVLRGHTFVVTGVDFNADGTQVASASPDGVVRVWAVDLDELIAIAESEVTRELSDEECQQYLHGPCAETLATERALGSDTVAAWQRRPS